MWWLVIAAFMVGLPSLSAQQRFSIASSLVSGVRDHADRRQAALWGAA